MQVTGFTYAFREHCEVRAELHAPAAPDERVIITPTMTVGLPESSPQCDVYPDHCIMYRHLPAQPGWLHWLKTSEHSVCV